MEIAVEKRRTMWLLGVVAAVATVVVAVTAGNVKTTISNFKDRSKDYPYDAHDGPVRQWEKGGYYYRYAMAYTDCPLEGEPGTGTRSMRVAMNRFVESAGKLTGAGDGFDCGQIVVPMLSEGWGKDCGFKTPHLGQTVMIWKSSDLVTWELVGDALDGAPSWLRRDSILFRPAVIRHAASNTWVMWINHLPRAAEGEPVVESYRVAGFVVGTSATPEGPFAFAETAAAARPEMAHAGGADFALLSDDKSGQAYIAYGAWHNYRLNESWHEAWLPDWAREGHQIAVQRLDPATRFTTAAADTKAVTVTTQSQEAPSFFRRGDYYYIIYGDLCCFCARGSDAKVHVSRSPMGPYVEAGQLNPRHVPGHVKMQNSDVIEVRKPGEDGGSTFVMTGDLWHSSASGLKGRDWQFWFPLNFVEKEVAGVGSAVPVPQTVSWVDSFELELDVKVGSEVENEVGVDSKDPLVAPSSPSSSPTSTPENREEL